MDDGEFPMPVFQKTTGLANNRILKDDDEEDEDLPAWAKSYESPYKGGYKPPLPSSSEDDAVDLTKDSQQQPTTEVPAGQQDDTLLATSSQLPATQENHNAVQPDRHTTPVKTPRGRRKAAATGFTQPLPNDNNIGKPNDTALTAQQPSQPLQPTQRNTHQLTSGDDTQQEAAPQVPDTQEDQAEETKKAPGRPAGSSKPPPPGSELPIMLPDKLPRNKVLVELSTRSHDESVVDLTGDSGAVGRVVVEHPQHAAGGSGKSSSQQQQQQQQLVIDLKGVIFKADALRLQGTALLLNIQANEARVEAVLNDYLQLTDQGAGGFDDEGLGGGGIAGLLGDDDEDHYVMTQQGEADPMDLDEEDSDGARKKKKTKKGDSTKQGKKSVSKPGGSRSKAGGAGGGGKGSGVKGGIKKKKPTASGKKPAAKPKTKK